MSTPPRPSAKDYATYLQQRAPARVRVLALCGAGAVLVAATVEAVYALAALHPLGLGLGGVAAVRLPALALAVLWSEVARRLPARLLTLPTVAVTVVEAALIDWGFLVQGFGNTPLHALILLLSAVVSMNLLPVQRRGRLTYLGLIWAAHLVLVLSVDHGGRPLDTAATAVLVLGATLSLHVILEAHFRSHRRQFELRAEVVQALGSLEASRAQLVRASGGLGGSSAALTGSAQALRQQADGLHREVESIAAMSERIAASAGELSERARASAGRAEEAHRRTGDIDQVVQALGEGMAEVLRSVEGTHQNVRELQAHSSSAHTVVSILHDVAEQTHVLSINASIEAARAGEAGHGFTVVAQEVRRLGAETSQRTAEVDALMVQMLRKMAATLAAAQRIGETTRRFAPVLEAARRTLQDIRHIVSQQQEDMGASNAQAGLQAQGTAGISEACTRLRALVASHARTASDVAATVTELGVLSDQLRELLPAERA